MAHCTQCGAPTRPNDQFCGKCGNPLNVSRDHQQRRPRRPEHVPALQTEAGRAAYDAVVARKNALSLYILVGGLAVSGALALAAFLASVGMVGYGVAVAILLVAASISEWVKRWSEKLYYTIPGSVDANGEHRCLHCGHRGIYRHGQYKSETRYADCSACKESLWVE